MHSAPKAPEPPSKTLLAAAGCAAGITITVWVMTAVGYFAGSLSTLRLSVQILAGLAAIAASVYLGGKYVIKMVRREAWYDGFAAGDEPLAEVIPLRDINGTGPGLATHFLVSSP